MHSYNSKFILGKMIAGQNYRIWDSLGSSSLRTRIARAKCICICKTMYFQCKTFVSIKVFVMMWSMPCHENVVGN